MFGVAIYMSRHREYLITFIIVGWNTEGNQGNDQLRKDNEGKLNRRRSTDRKEKEF